MNATNATGGRMDRRERADCVIAALSDATGLPYETCHAIARDAGRRDRGRCSLDNAIAVARGRGVALRKVRIGPRTLARFLREHPTGRYVVRKRGHALSVIDGVPGDGTPLGSIVRDAWEVLPPPVRGGA